MRSQQVLGWALIIVFVWTLQFSSLTAGLSYLHHLLLLVPFLAPVLAVLVDAAISKKRQLFATVLALCLCAYPIFNRYALILPRIQTGAPLDQSPARQIADYFIDRSLQNRSIYIMNDHIAYWHMHSHPLTLSTTHPSTIGKDFLLQVLYGPDWSSPLEMQRLLALEPEFIVKKEQLFYLKYQLETTEILAAALSQNYTLIHSVEDANIYRRDV